MNTAWIVFGLAGVWLAVMALIAAPHILVYLIRKYGGES